MFEENDFLIELEVVLHKTEDEELLNYMTHNIDYVVTRMNDIVSTVKHDRHNKNYFLPEDLDRMLYLYYTVLTLWNSRN
jgi:protein associated with RNAse G/E